MERFDSPKITASLFMHEFGHAMGLDAHQDGIDEERYSQTEYDSVMNYNGLYRHSPIPTAPTAWAETSGSSLPRTEHGPTSTASRTERALAGVRRLTTPAKATSTVRCCR